MANGVSVVDFQDLIAAGDRRQRFVDEVGRAMADIGFFAVKNHGIAPSVIDGAYASARAFFSLPDDVKRRYEDAARKAQRGYTSFGKEHAKGALTPDMKEFWQVGRTDVPDDHAVHALYGPNVWPAEVPAFERAMRQLYEALDGLGREFLVVCAQYLGEDAAWLSSMAMGGDTILRVIHYPPVGDDASVESVRAGAHEDINLITLLVGATEDGLELRQNDGTWRPIKAGHDEILIDAGDMLQNCTNGIFRSTTHRVVRPATEKRGVPRFSMPCFIHPRGEVDLTPSPSCIEKSGGKATYPSTTAGEYLAQRLKEIGVG